MTHGPEYRVRDGKRPAWLDDDDKVAICQDGQWLGLQDGQWLGLGVGVVAGNWHWHKGITALYLKDPNHWANAPIAAGLEPYRPKEGEGDGPPADFKPGGRVMFRNGAVCSDDGTEHDFWQWIRSDRAFDVIGYERTEEPPLAELLRLGQAANQQRFMAALIEIRDGHNDPRARAAEALEGCSYAKEPKQ